MMNGAATLQAFSTSSLSVPQEQNDPACFHCGLPLPGDAYWSVVIDDVERRMCCPGCEAVARTIMECGFADYYRTRTALPAAAEQAAVIPEELKLYDGDESLRKFSADEETGEAVLSVEGIRCAACIWLIERRLAQLPGMQKAELNVATERLVVRWSKKICKPSQILQSLQQLGYKAYPYDAARHTEQLRRSSRILGRRLFVAGLCMMQVMMYAVPAYFGDGAEMEPDMASLMRWASLLLTVPAVFYSAKPFFQGAWTNLKNRALGMDVPVTLGIAAAFAGSTLATWRGFGQVYFDTVTMFIFLLLCSRYLELNARRKAANAIEKLQHSLPASALRMAGYPENRETELVAASALEKGDHILVRPGDPIASDGILVEGQTSINLSILSGESAPQHKDIGAMLPGGAINETQAVIMRVTSAAEESTLSSLIKMIERAGYGKPQLSMWADRTAAWFVSGLLLFAVAILALWLWIDPSRAWEIAVAVLVVSCPCALSLATPTALATATDRLAKAGVLIVKPHVLETLHRTTHVVFDKTGTLTVGSPQLAQLEILGDMPHEDCLRIAAAMEQSSAHPIGKALIKAAGGPEFQNGFASVAKDIHHQAGKGLEALIDGQRYRLGSEGFVREISGELPRPAPAHDEMIQVYLGTQGKWLACFGLADSLRSDVSELIDYFKKQGKKVILLSGDRETVVRHVAGRLGIEEAYGERLPDQKLEFVKSLQEGGAVVAMVGDGINDAAVLHAADVSFAMSEGATLAQVHADAVLLSERLSLIRNASEMADRTMRVIRQNLSWSMIYNVVAIPAAALGLLNPWLSAVGMSASSAMVVLNALRLRRFGSAAKSAKQSVVYMPTDPLYQSS